MNSSGTWGTVLRVLRELYDGENGVPEEDVLREAVREGVARDDAEEAIVELRKRGEIYSPDANEEKLKPTPTRYE